MHPTQRRKHPRKDSGASLILAGHQHDVVDLSLKGLSIRTDKQVPADRPLPFSLRLPHGTVEGLAQVRWSQKEGWRKAHGLEIVKIGPLARRSLVKHLDPYHFGAMEVLDLTLQFACAAVTVLCVNYVLRSDPSLAQTAVETLPWLFLAAGLGGGALVMSRS